MGTWKGYLLKTGSGANEKKFPDKYIKADSYESTPNQREEIKAYRNENSRDLVRVTAQGTKTSIRFTTRPNLHLAEKQKLQKWFTDAESDHHQRKINIEFWNDESNSYQTGDFYRPDLNFKIKKLTDDDIIYDELTIELVEY